MNKTDTLGAVLERIVQDFEAANLHYGHGTSNAYDEAAWLILHQLNLPVYQEVSPTFTINETQLAAINSLAQQRIRTRKPLAYLINSCWFCDLEFYIDENAIIPRSPIAELIKNNFQPWLALNKTPLDVLDMCTGSACIAIAMAKNYENARVDAVDISSAALTVAKKNVDMHHVDQQVNLIQSDGLSGLHGKQYDLILCNPPYVDAEEMRQLPQEFLHEPALALASGETGLDFVDDFLASAHDNLTEQGAVILEVGNTQASFDKVYANLEKIWIDFEHGGDGVCIMDKNSLLKLRTRKN